MIDSGSIGGGSFNGFRNGVDKAVRRSLELIDGHPRLSLALTIFYSWVAVNVVASLATLVLMYYMHRRRTMKINLYVGRKDWIG
jgi:hypothetical protein